MDVRSLNPPHLRMPDTNVACVRGDYAAGGRSGEENPRRTIVSCSFSSIDSGVASL
jgi:hypothetical protein